VKRAFSLEGNLKEQLMGVAFPGGYMQIQLTRERIAVY
jgi:hypothetical protein